MDKVCPAPEGLLDVMWALTTQHGPAWGLVGVLILALAWVIRYALKREREWAKRLEEELDRRRQLQSRLH